MPNCWIVVKQKRRTGKKGIGSVAKMCRTLEKGGVEKAGGSIANVRRVRVGRSVEVAQGQDRSGMQWLPPKSPLDLTTQTMGRSSSSWRRWKVAATSLHNDVLPNAEECHEREANCAHANVDSLVGGFEGYGGGEVAGEVTD